MKKKKENLLEKKKKENLLEKKKLGQKKKNLGKTKETWF